MVMSCWGLGAVNHRACVLCKHFSIFHTKDVQKEVQMLMSLEGNRADTV